MTWKNWGDHPVVVGVSLIAALAGVAGLVSTQQWQPQSLSQSQPQLQSSTQGGNSPIISSGGGDVDISINNPIKPETQERALKLRVHRAQFVGSPKEYYFINATNISPNRALEITHIWHEAGKHHIPVNQPSRLLPVRLDIDQSWETFIDVSDLPEINSKNPYENFRARISTGEIFQSELNLSVPPYGSVPGGPVQRE
jgi:hypothetical protein